MSSSSSCTQVARSKPFTQTEKDELCICVKRYAAIIENKRTDGTTLQKKQNAWISLCKEYNSSGQVTERSVQQLKRAWEAIKAALKKSTAALNRHRMGTGGGPSIAEPLPNPLVEQIAPHLTYVVAQHHDSDALVRTLPLGNEDGAGCSTAIDSQHDFADDESLESDGDVEMEQNNEPFPLISQTPETPRPATESAGTATSSRSSSRCPSRLAVISEEHGERMSQLTCDAARQTSLHELRILESRAALRAAEFRAQREEFLLEDSRRQALAEEAFEKERRCLVLEQMREKHELECKRLGK